MKKKHIRILLPGLFIILATACTISPEIEDRPELKPVVTSIARPEITRVINNQSKDSPSIEIMWNPVDKASFYVVEYQSAIDYLGNRGGEFEQHITQTNSFTLDSSYLAAAGSDKRFVFRVKAGSRSTSGGSVLYSPYSELKEGAIISSFTLSAVLEESVLTLYSSYSKIKSVLTEANIVTPSVSYYDGDYTDGSELPEPILSSSIRLSSAESKIITAVLSVDGTEAERIKVPVHNPVDYYPPHPIEISGTRNDVGAITVSWTVPEINRGLEAYSVVRRFRIERALSGSASWKQLIELYEKDASESGAFIAEGEGKFSYRDESAEPNTEYRYRAITEYVMEVNGNKVVVSEDTAGLMESEILYAADSEVKSFSLSLGSGFDTDPVVSGDAEYTVNLEWTPYHEIPEGYEYAVSRWDFDRITFLNGNPADGSETVKYTAVYNGRETSAADRIILTEEENRKTYSFIYYIQVRKSDEASSDNKMIAAKWKDDSSRDAIVRTNPSIKQISFIKPDSLRATGGNDAYSDKIMLSWDFDREALEREGLDLSKTYALVLKKGSSDSFYSEAGSSGAGETEYIDNAVTPGEEYSYMLKPYYDDEASPYNGAQNTDSSSVLGSTLSSVTGLNGSVNTSNDSVSVSWNAVPYAHGYKVFFRENGSSQWKTANEGNPVEAEEYRITVEGDGIKPGIEYEIAISAFDASGSAMEPDGTVSVRGSVLGPVSAKATGDDGIQAESIEVTWKPVENATGYKLTVLDDTGKAVIEGRMLRERDLDKTDSGYKYVFSSDSIEFRAYAEAVDEEGFFINKDALSRKYSFRIVPVAGDIEPKAYGDLAVGYWIMPPRGIAATKADFRDMVTVSWTPEPLADAYKIYYRKKDSGSGWEMLREWIQNAEYQHITDENVIYEYSVASIKNREEGAMQISDASSENTGYILMQPAGFAADDLGVKNGEKLIQFTFSSVPGAAGYYIHVNNDVRDEYKHMLRVSDIQEVESIYDIQSSVSSGKAYKIRSSGLVYYYLPRMEATDYAYNTAVITARNGDELSNKSRSSAVTYKPKELTDNEIVNFVNRALSNAFLAADSYFDGDWWGGEGTGDYKKKTYEEKGSFSMSNCYAPRFGSSTKNDGSAEFTEYYSNDIEISGSLSVRAKDGGNAGYLGSDPLESISGTVSVTLPYGFGKRTIQYSTYNVDNSGGTVAVDGRDVPGESISTVIMNIK